jgi:hypothetical protein
MGLLGKLFGSTTYRLDPPAKRLRLAQQKMTGELYRSFSAG